ncbi:MAG: hypothetical protein WEC75_11090 [Dehalococcoidia bacterium]
MHPVLLELLVEERRRELGGRHAARIAEARRLKLQRGGLRRTIASALLRLALSLDRSAGERPAGIAHNPGSWQRAE